MTDKIKVAKIVSLAVLVLALLYAVSQLFGTMGYSYADAGRYTTGPASFKGTVKRLEVDWIDGTVTVQTHEADEVELQETSRKTLREDQKLRWWLDGETLRIQYAKPGLQLGWNLEKELTVTLPRTLLSQVRISATSADLVLRDLETGILNLQTTSGKMQATVAAETIQTHATSGDQQLTVTGTVKELQAGATSGNIGINLGALENGKIDTTSGSVYVIASETVSNLQAHATSGYVGIEAGSIGKTDINTTSGNVSVQTGGLESLNISTTSGDVTASLPREPGLSMRVSTTSGSVENGLGMNQKGQEYTCGDESGKVNISTTSGGVTIR